MTDYRDDVRRGERDYYWTLPRAVFALFALVVLVGVVAWVIQILSAPGRVVSRTLDTDNIIARYEFFHDANNQVKARTGQIASHKKIIADNADASEKTRLRIELAAIQQSCRDLVARYNANATKVNHAIFKGREAPDNINPSTCE